MKILRTVEDIRSALQPLRSRGRQNIGLVPTMGALHAGHLTLVRAARAACDHVVVSLFVNPTQFAPGEDLNRYPRTFEADRTLLQQEHVDLLFAPSVAELFPGGGLATSVDPGELGNRLDGLSRPGHFRGVATVVCKLFGITQPDLAFFGQKDAAQVAVLRAMVRDLNLPVQLSVCATVRDPDGLALSSRNVYLSGQQRSEALAIPRALLGAQAAVLRGERSSANLLRSMRDRLASPALRIDYVEAVDADTLLPVEQVRPNTLLAIAAFVGDTRLIDNLLITQSLLEQVA